MLFLSSATGDKITEATGSGDAYALLSYFGKFNYSYASNIWHRQHYVMMVLPSSVLITVGQSSRHFLWDGELRMNRSLRM